jgi:pseudouridine kinase
MAQMPDWLHPDGALMEPKASGLDTIFAAVVIGGSNIDRKCQALAPLVMGTSNPGTERSSVGGVGRNVAENLARLGVSTALVTALGADAEGLRIRTATTAAGVYVARSFETRNPTGSYTVVLNDSGEMVTAVASMAGTDELTPSVVETARGLVERAGALVLDCNVPAATLLHSARIAEASGVRIVVDTVSAHKAVRASGLLSAGVRIHTITPDLSELLALSALVGESESKVEASIAMLHEAGVENVWVRLGAGGSIFSEGSTGKRTHMPPLPAMLVDATGAGDAMLAAYVAALLEGRQPLGAALRGRAAAAITIESELTVSPLMSAAAVAVRAERGKFEAC